MAPTPDPSNPPTAAGPASPDRPGPWPLRILWLALPFTVGAALGEALNGRSGPVTLTAAVLAWSAWFVSLVATFVPHPIGLTVLRVGGPAVLVTGIAAVVAGRPDAWVAVASVAVAVAATGAALHPDTADRCVDGASYGPERRVALRIPGSLLLGPLPLAWLVLTAGMTVGPMLLAARQWVAGGLLTVVGLGLAVLAARALHGLSNRFVVLVPAGFVLHDRAALLDPVLFARSALSWIGPAEVGTTATDLTLGATGLVVEVRLQHPLDIPLRTGRRASSMTTVEAVLFSPLRPGRTLELAAAHRLPVG